MFKQIKQQLKLLSSDNLTKAYIKSQENNLNSPSDNDVNAIVDSLIDDKSPTCLDQFHKLWNFLNKIDFQSTKPLVNLKILYILHIISLETLTINEAIQQNRIGIDKLQVIPNKRDVINVFAYKYLKSLLKRCEIFQILQSLFSVDKNLNQQQMQQILLWIEYNLDFEKEFEFCMFELNKGNNFLKIAKLILEDLMCSMTRLANFFRQSMDNFKYLQENYENYQRFLKSHKIAPKLFSFQLKVYKDLNLSNNISYNFQIHKDINQQLEKVKNDNKTSINKNEPIIQQQQENNYQENEIQNQDQINQEKQTDENQQVENENQLSQSTHEHLDFLNQDLLIN